VRAGRGSTVLDVQVQRLTVPPNGESPVLRGRRLVLDPRVLRPNPSPRASPLSVAPTSAAETSPHVTPAYLALPWLEVQDDVEPAVAIEILVASAVGPCTGRTKAAAAVHAQGVEQFGREQRDANQLIAVRVRRLWSLPGSISIRTRTTRAPSSSYG
jgi:hypothetical protein